MATSKADTARSWELRAIAERGAWAPTGKTLKGFTAQPAPDKVTLDERRGFSRSEEPLAYHPKMGRSADLYNHLFASLAMPESVESVVEDWLRQSERTDGYPKI